MPARREEFVALAARVTALEAERSDLSEIDLHDLSDLVAEVLDGRKEAPDEKPDDEKPDDPEE